MKREIIKIDEIKCNGCGLCIPACPEGALQIIDGKARLVSDLMCDGLGACLGECPEGAISVEVREAEPYNETAVMSEIVRQGFNTVVAHLKHLKEHGEMEYFGEAVAYLKAQSGLGYQAGDVMEKIGEMEEDGNACSGGCPGGRTIMFDIDKDAVEKAAADETQPLSAGHPSALRQWPVQLHLLNPQAPYFLNADVLLAADCTAFALGNFHSLHLRGKSLAIACPKLDSGTDIYVQKLVSMIDDARINTLNVMVMEVPCCNGLLGLAGEALSRASRKVPLKRTVVGIRGDILSEEWV